jgi:hypothetical protein
VKRANRPVVNPGFLQFNVRANNFNNIKPVFDFFYGRVSNHNFNTICGNEVRKEDPSSLSDEDFVLIFTFALARAWCINRILKSKHKIAQKTQNNNF